MDDHQFRTYDIRKYNSVDEQDLNGNHAQEEFALPGGKDIQASLYHRHSESMKMSSEMTPINPMNLSVLSKKQDDFREQFKMHRSFLRFRYPNIEINDKDKLESAYGGGPMNLKLLGNRQGKRGSTKGSQSSSRSRNMVREEIPGNLNANNYHQKVALMAAKTSSVNTINTGSIYNEPAKVRQQLQPITYNPPTALHSHQTSHKTTPAAFHLVKRRPKKLGGSLSPIARNSANASESINLDRLDEKGTTILNINIPNSSLKSMKESVETQDEEEHASTQKPEKKKDDRRSPTVEKVRISADSKPTKRSKSKDKDKDKDNAQKESKRPKIKPRLERNANRKHHSVKVTKSQKTQALQNNIQKGSIEMNNTNMNDYKNRMKKYEQVEETIRMYNQPPEAQQQERPPPETSLDRYYRLYVHDGPDSIKNAPLPQYTEKFKAFLKMSSEKRHNLETYELKGITK